MNRFFCKTHWLGIISTLILGVTMGQTAPPVGSYMVEFNDPQLRIWDPTGNYTESFDTGDDWDVSYTMNVDGGGNLTGSGTFSVDSCAFGACIFLSGDFLITGKMSGGGDNIRIKMNFDMEGTGRFQGLDLFFFAKMKVNAEVNTLSANMVGTVNGKVKVEIPGEGKGGAKVPKSSFSASFPAGADGVWTLFVNIMQPDPAKPDRLGGDASIELSSGATLNLDQVKGKYKEKTDETKLSLKATKLEPESKGVSLKLETEPGASLDLKKIKGKVAKQKVALDTTKTGGGEPAPTQATVPQPLHPTGIIISVERTLAPNLPFPPVPLR